jgi:4-amino-4-deoxy-L-arabinose transferase-like glycosyltransferase
VAHPLRSDVAALAALTVIRSLFAAILPLTPDEAYYWVWSHALAPGYVDHPPMVALWIRTGTLLLGETPLGVRLLGPLAAFAGTLLLADAAERAFPGRRACWTAGALWNATLLVGAGSVTMTPDSPLLLFWCATVWAMLRIATGGGAVWWLAAGLFAGLALASKYTAAFLWIGIGLWVLAVPSARRQLRGAAPWIGALLGVAVFLPVVLWNADHGWASFLKQGGRVADWRPERAMGFLAELIGGQIGLATPGVWVLCVAGVVASVRRDAIAVLLLALSVLPALVFLQHALGDRVQGNWPAIVYPAATVAAAGLTAHRWTRLVRPSVGLGVAVSAVVLMHAATGFIPFPPRADPAARQLAGWPELAVAAETIRQRQSAAYVVAEEYALIAELAWNAPGSMPVIGIEARLRLMALPPADLNGLTGILIRAEHRGEEIDPATWASAEPLGFVERGSTERYRVWRVVGRISATAMPQRAFAERR